MAFGTTPKYEYDLPVYDIDDYQFIALALAAAKKLHWHISYHSGNEIIADTDRGMMNWNAAITIRLESKIANITSTSIGEKLLDLGKNKDEVDDFVKTYLELKDTLAEQPPTEAPAEDETLPHDEPNQIVIPLQVPTPFLVPKRDKNFFDLFIPIKGFFATPLILDLNLLVFIVMICSGVHFLTPTTESLLDWGANYREYTLNGQWWRLITCTFIHIGVPHLLMNMYAFVFVGLLLEPILGRARFLLAYLLTGVLASAASLWWHYNVVSAGASGAIFGMYGVLLALLATKIIERKARKALVMSIGFFVVYNLANGMKAGVDNAAHVGGLISGLLIGFGFIPGLLNPGKRTRDIGIISGLSIAMLVFAFMACSSLEDGLPEYKKKITDFANMESMALEVLHMKQWTAKSLKLNGLQDRGIYYWTECIKVIDDADKLTIPEQLHARDKKLKEYCQLRVAQYELMYKAVNEDTDKYNDQIAEYAKKIEVVLMELKNQ